MRRDLKADRLLLRGDARDEMLRLLSNVRGSLQGNAGILVEQQDSIAEMVWGPAGRVITNLEFRKRLLELPGWEQFINLFRFFVHFRYKVEHEIAKTIPALRELIDKVDQLFVQESLRSTSV